MRILIIGPAHQRFRTEFYLKRGFESAGHAVRYFRGMYHAQLPWSNPARALLRCVRRWDPDFILTTRSRGLQASALAQACHGRNAAMWYFDAPDTLPGDVLEKAAATGTLFVTNRGHADRYRAAGVRRVLFLPQACDERLHRRLDGPLRYEISFVGNAASEESRRAFLEKLGKHAAVHVWGPANRAAALAGCRLHRVRVYNRSLCRVAGRSLAVIGLNSFASMNTVTAYASNRVWLTLGCGGLYMGYRTPGIEEVVPESLVDYFDSPEEVLQRLRFYARDPGARAERQQAGYRWVHRFHTYRQRVDNLLSAREYRSFAPEREG